MGAEGRTSGALGGWLGAVGGRLGSARLGAAARLAACSARGGILATVGFAYTLAGRSKNSVHFLRRGQIPF